MFKVGPLQFDSPLALLKKEWFMGRDIDVFALTVNTLDMLVRMCFTKLCYWVDLVSCFLVYM